MDGSALSGGFADPPRDAARAFRAIMQAMARPGCLHDVAGASAPAPVSGAAAAVLLTLCDADTPLFLAGAHDCQPVRDWITFQTGAPFASAGSAMFALGAWQDLCPLHRYAQGQSDYPDRSATLIVEVPELVPRGARLTGPGIRDEARLGLPDVPAFQDNAAQYPLGLDFYFACGSQLAALPRTTHVEEG